MMDYIKTHKFISGMILFYSLVIISAIIIFANQNQAPPSDITPERPPGEILRPSTAIDNWTDTVKNIPDNEKTAVQSTINSTLALNLPDGSTLLGTDATMIRENSFHQTYDDQTQIYTTEFLIDIPKLEQTYRVVNYYSDLPQSETGLYDYTTQVFCPTTAELIWDNFNCSDRFKIENGG